MRPAGRRLADVDGAGDVRDVVAVNTLRMETEALELRAQIAGIEHFAHRAVELNFIAIENGDQMIQAMPACVHARFPDLAFLNLAVA